MQTPLPLAAMAMACGALLWPWWTPPLMDALCAAVALALAAVVGRRLPVARPLWLLGALCLGAASVAAGRGPAPPPGPLIGEVHAVSGPWAVLVTAEGAVSVRFSGEVPADGQRVAALTRPTDASVILPGAWDGGRADRLLGRPLQRVSAWVPLEPRVSAGPRFPDARHGGLLRALVTGARDELPEDERLVLQQTGTTHLLSVSGLHIGGTAALAGGLAWLALTPLAFARWPRLRDVIAGAVGLAVAWTYSSMVGWPVPAVRSACMVASAVAARALGRRGGAWSALGLAAIVVILWDPSQVLEPSALLSFGAVAGILWVGPRITRYLPPDTPRPLRWGVAALATSLGATAGTLPITAWIFQGLPPLAPLANLVAIPLIGTLATTLAALAAFGPPAMAPLAEGLADHLCGAGLALLRPLARDPWIIAVGPLGATLLALALPLRRHGGLVAGLALIALGLREVPCGGLHITWLNVGQGDAAVLRWPDGRVWLVDGGPPSGAVLSWLRREGIQEIEAIFLSHPDIDHLGGLLPVVGALPTSALWVPRSAREDEPEYAAFLADAAARGVALRGPSDPAPRGARLWAPEARSDNDSGLVLRVDHGQRSALFTGDVEAEGERWLSGRLGPVDVVKVPHHGSRTSSSEALVSATRPRLAIISVGRGNPFGHPDADVVTRWAPARVLRTDLDGTVEIWTDGQTWAARAWRPDEGWRPLEVPDWH